MPTLTEELSLFKKDFDIHLERFLDAELAHYEGVDPYLTRIHRASSEQILRGGKRFRPFIGLQAYLLAGGKDIDAALGAFVAVELVHQFLLIHDDVVDHDETRYGTPSLHNMLSNQEGLPESLGEALAIGAGDRVYGMAMKALCQSTFPPEILVRAIEWVNDYLALTIAGWTRQFYSLPLAIDEVSEEDYLASTRLVAAHYTIEGPMLLGLILAGNSAYANVISEYALHVGVGFQIQDDILGMLGDTSKTGKPVGNDFREGKKTVLVVHAYRHARGADKSFLASTIGTPIDQHALDRLISILHDTGSVKYASDMATTYARKGVKALDQLDSSVPADTLLLLKLFADHVIEREY